MPGQTRLFLFPDRRIRLPFNGGPGNCPAKRGQARIRRALQRRLQWRAGQLPGQTVTLTTEVLGLRSPFNGGPGNCPAKLEWPEYRLDGSCTLLQWRAGQLPGQTRRLFRRRRRIFDPFNGGPGNCPAKQRSFQEIACKLGPLQWRAGQLPGQTTVLTCPPDHTLTLLQWRAGQLPGQTGSSEMRVE